ncbi:transcriptional regulator [Lentilactobacillus buchneri]|uniref:transcriptional regulator n=2 Tax=Lentilactobacillus TaxID=2767893 RepID=UPI0020BF14AF|nr:transcriptional regulator [Lentilactobacillus buchneri]
MKTRTKRMIEEYLREYPETNRYIKERTLQIIYPAKQPDENVGGGRAQYKYDQSVVYTAIGLAEDKILNTLKHRRDVIDDCLDDAGKDTETIIKELYFKRHPQYSINGLVVNGLIHVSQSKAYELENSFIEEVAEGLDIYDLSDVE